MLLGMEYSLKQYLSKYQNPELARKDILAAIQQYKGLQPKLERFVFPNGCTKNLVNLSGTIPVLVSGVVYNIPVCIWTMDTHPNHPPMCYVRPTSDMQIKSSMYVDHSGKIYLPYLHEWTPANSSDLVGLIQIMIYTFGDHPPVYAKPRTEPNTTPYPQQVYMPMPGVSSTQHTPYPPYPPMGLHNPSPVQYPPAYPPQPPRMLCGGTPVSTTTQQTNSGGTITEEHIRASLVSAVEHKLKRRLDEHFAQTKAELAILQQSTNELQQGKLKIDSIFEKLNREKMDLERYITLLKAKDAELEEAIANHKDETEIDVDEAVITTAPLYKQILNSYAEEAATEDAIYYMGEALRAGVIDLDVFLKQVRTLSRKQFMLRALIQKCRQKADLSG